MELPSHDAHVLNTPLNDITKAKDFRRDARGIITPQEVAEKRNAVKNLKFPQQKASILKKLLNILRLDK